MPDSVNYNQFGDQVLAITPEHASILAAAPIGKEEVRRYIYENARVPIARFSPAFIEKHGRHRFAKKFDLDNPQTRIPIVERLDDIIVMVAGGAGQHSLVHPDLRAVAPRRPQDRGGVMGKIGWEVPGFDAAEGRAALRGGPRRDGPPRRSTG